MVRRNISFEWNFGRLEERDAAIRTESADTQAVKAAITTIRKKCQEVLSLPRQDYRLSQRFRFLRVFQCPSRSIRSGAGQ